MNYVKFKNKREMYKNKTTIIYQFKWNIIKKR